MKDFLWKKVSPTRLCLYLVLIFSIYFLFASDYKFIYLSGESMQPSISNKEWIVAQKRDSLDKKWEPKRFDVVILRDAGLDEALCKRVIGLPGDIIEIKEGYIYLNQHKLKDPFGKGKMLTGLGDNPLNDKYTNHLPSVIPQNFVWVIGDNRAESWYGLIRFNQIEALVIW